MDFKKHLLSLADPKHQAFFSKLVPGETKILGVRLLDLKKLAKVIVRDIENSAKDAGAGVAAKDTAKNNFQSFLKAAPDYSVEEIILQGYVIAYMNVTFEERFAYIKNFVPNIKNWAVCDTFCVALKIPADQKSRFWDYIIYCSKSADEFTIRFALVSMFKFIDDEHVDEILTRIEILNEYARETAYGEGVNESLEGKGAECALRNEKSIGKEATSAIGIKRRVENAKKSIGKEATSAPQSARYVQMGAAWLISAVAVKYPQKIFEFLKKGTLSSFTHRMAIRKITESFRLSQDFKSQIKLLRK